MRERRYVKLRSDMYDDTKFKIIDTMENRDTINYIWTRILTLCGKINNRFGYLLLSKNMIYTIDLLAIEFNRSKEQIEEAIDVFIELKMMDKDENGMLKVCNWGKHQGYKDKSKDSNGNIMEMVADKNEERLEASKNIKREKEKLSDKRKNLNVNKSIVEDNKKNDTKLIQIQNISKEKKRNDKLIEITNATKINTPRIEETKRDSHIKEDKKEDLNINKKNKDDMHIKKRKKKKQEVIEVLGDCDSDIMEKDICGVVEDEEAYIGKVVKTFNVN